MITHLAARIKNTRRIRLDLALRFIWDSSARWTVASSVLVLIQGPLPLGSLYLMKVLVDRVTAGVTVSGSGVPFREVLVVVVLMAALTLITSLLGTIAGLVRQAQSLIVTDYMQNIIHAKSVEVDLEYYENAAYHDSLRRAQREAAYRPMQILDGLTQLGQNVIALVAIVGLLLAFHWSMGVVLVIAVLPEFAVRLLYSGKMYAWQRARTQLDRETNYFSWMLTGEQHAKEIRLFGLGELFMGRYRDLRLRLRREQLQIASRQAVTSFLAGTGASLAVYGAYAFIAARTLDGALSLGSMVMYYQAFQRGQGALNGVMSSVARLYESNLFLSDLAEFLNLTPKLVSPPQPRPVPRPLREGIAFDGVTFRYPNSTRTALQDISLAIRPGERIALVGENGSGKTTLIKLLCRLYDPTEGRVTLDGADLRDLAVTDLRREISVILQDYAQYNLTAADNIWFGDVSAPPDADRIAEVARQSGAHDVIAGLHSGYDTILGKLFQDGEQLSIGEWQKVALARAFMRDAQIIILDEPTSAMDARAEYELFARLHELVAGRTTITISHRFSTVRMADCIYVMDGGRILERGTHDTLMALGGKYALLFNMQAQHYK